MAAAYTPSAQVKLTNVAYVRLQKKGKRFEIACYRNKILSWRNKVETDISEVLQIDTIFSNVSKGMLASSKDLSDAFGTLDNRAICKEILDKGETQVSEQERGAFYDSMFRDVAAIVADKAINPVTQRPYTISIIQNAMRQIHYGVSINKSAKSQALDVIRKLKEVMPITRASMLLRIVSPLSCSSAMKQHILDDLGLDILREASTDGDNAVSHYDIRVDPEMFRKIEEAVQSQTSGMGRLEVLQLRDSVPANPPRTSKQSNKSDETAENTTANATATSSTSSAPKSNRASKGSHIKISSKSADVSNAYASNENKKKTVFAFLSDNDSDGDNDSDASDSGTEGGDRADDGNDGNDAKESEVDADILESTKKLAVGKEDTSVNSNANADEMENGDAANIEEVGSDRVSINGSSSGEEVVYGMVSKNKKQKKKKPKSTSEGASLDAAASSSSNQVSTTKADKKSKKNKRLEKEETKEKQKKMEILHQRLELEKSRAAMEGSSKEKASVVDGDSNTSAEASVNAAPTQKGQSCNTCGGNFLDSAAYRNHFRSEWHRHNLKRKMKNLPIIPTEEAFSALPVTEIDI